MKMRLCLAASTESRPKGKRQDWPQKTKEDEMRSRALRLDFFRSLSFFSAKSSPWFHRRSEPDGYVLSGVWPSSATVRSAFSSVLEGPNAKPCPALLRPRTDALR